MASAEPANQCGPTRICAGTVVTASPTIGESCHAIAMWRFRLWLLYCVSTAIRPIRPFTRLDSAKSIRRYVPPNGTADRARSAVSGISRRPCPNASTSAITRWLSRTHGTDERTLRIHLVGPSLPRSCQGANEKERESSFKSCAFKPIAPRTRLIDGQYRFAAIAALRNVESARCRVSGDQNPFPPRGEEGRP